MIPIRKAAEQIAGRKSKELSIGYPQHRLLVPRRACTTASSTSKIPAETTGNRTSIPIRSNRCQRAKWNPRLLRRKRKIGSSSNGSAISASIRIPHPEFWYLTAPSHYETHGLRSKRHDCTSSSHPSLGFKRRGRFRRQTESGDEFR